MSNKKIEKRIQGLKDYDNNSDFAFFKELQDLRETLEVIKEVFKDLNSSKLDYLKGEDGRTPTREDLISLIKPLIPRVKDGKDGEDGETPTREDLISLIKPLIPKPIKGKDGENADMDTIIEEVLSQTPEIDYEKVIDEVIKQIPRNGEEIRNALELLQEKDKLDKSAIKGLDETLKKIEKTIIQSKQMMISPSARDLFDVIDLSDQLDGVTKTFNIPATWVILSVDLSSFPYGALRKGTDYTSTPTTITFTSEISASTQLSIGQTCILTVVKS